MENPFEKIKTFLDENHVEYSLTEHEAVFTSEEAAQVRGFDLHTGAKALVLKGNNDFLLAVIPGDHRLDSKKLKELLSLKKLRFATPEEVEKIMGCQIGACYPFGNLCNLPMLVDEALSENETIAFNPGVHTKSIQMPWKEYERILKPRLVDISRKKDPESL